MDMEANELENLRACKAGVDHIQRWIHSGSRESDSTLQASQAGRNVCEWITEYADSLRAAPLAERVMMAAHRIGEFIANAEHYDEPDILITLAEARELLALLVEG